ncbi:prion-inhibition and propagation-domain-containing protein [Dactylonectria estremocensis]|uniref:Prion-inhibition and propagation-domain-containing protein n=1 Tax=Dactylonectria estremocensis TaxID=1079267 RepID=A0A9P9JB83_9HYPO|nr:prion-inhibition and propagation-domain-containing protein [Dactylonectria estremocensis]
MAELAIGIVSLATTFDTIINCFEYIHLGKTFGADFDDCVITLDNARLKLSRWGQAVGLDQVKENTVSLRGTKLSKENIPEAEKRLGFILNEIQKVKKLSGKFDQSLVLSPEWLSSNAMALHEQMDKLARGRQNRLSMPDKVKWAIYDRKHFKSMIEKIGHHTEALVDLFPPEKDLEKPLCDNETLAFCESLRWLKDAIMTRDEKLAKALDAVLKPLETRVENNIRDSRIGNVSVFGSTIHQVFS